MSRFGLIGVVVGVASFGQGCVPQVGNGALTTQQRLVPPFVRVAVTSGLQVAITRGAQSLSFTTDSNLQPSVLAQVDEGTLRLEVARGARLEPTGRIVAVVTTEVLEGLTSAEGSEVHAEGTTPTPLWPLVAEDGSTVSVRGLAAAHLRVEASGGSRVHVAGEAPSVTVTGAGSSQVDTDGVSADSVTLEVSGSTVARVRATRAARGAASGRSHLFISGNATTRDIAYRDEARITWLDD